MSATHDSPTASRWFQWFDRLQALPTADEEDAVWLGRVVAELRTVLSAAAVVCLLPEEGSGWRRWLDVVTGDAVESEVIDDLLPRGWTGRLLSGSAADVWENGTRAPEAAEARWDGRPWPAGTQLAGARIGLPAARHGALIVVEPAVPAPIEHLVRLLARAIQNRGRVRRLAEEVITDELTGTFNYRHLRQALRREVRRAARFNHRMSVLMLDVDNLKEYNERFGHLGGSQVLRTLAEVLRAGTRDIDILAKYGGDEFLLILPHTDKAGALVLADRLRGRVAEHAFPPLARGAMTCSLGVATFPDDADGPEELVAAADAALFTAKRAGRNRVEAA